MSQSIKPRDAFHDSFRTYRAARNRVAMGTGSSLGGIFAECGVSSGSNGNNQPRKTDRMVEFAADFELCGRVALEDSRWAMQRIFDTYVLQLMPHSECHIALGFNLHSFNDWLRQMKKLIGMQCYVRGLWSPVEGIGTQCYFGVEDLIGVRRNLRETMYLDRRESLR